MDKEKDNEKDKEKRLKKKVEEKTITNTKNEKAVKSKERMRERGGKGYLTPFAVMNIRYSKVPRFPFSILEK